MHNLRAKLFAFFVSFIFPLSSFAQTRGGTCRSAICEFTGSIVALIVLTIFLLSVAASIATHGFWKGLIRNTGIRFLFLYICVIGGVLLIAAVAHEVAGDYGPFILFLLLFLPKDFLSKFKLPKSDESNT